MSHTNDVSIIEQRAYALAASCFLKFVGDWDKANKHYEAYTQLLEHYNDYAEFDDNIAEVWQPFENDHLDSILEYIDDMAQAIIGQVEQALEDVKASLVDGAIEATLPDDFNQLDMKALAQPVAEST
tara:strand:- start:4966 stop:5346 length:381 start_codon:yes stop_codon:yes gene_type:complete